MKKSIIRKVFSHMKYSFKKSYVQHDEWNIMIMYLLASSSDYLHIIQLEEKK
jgi:hypothetical protein